MANRTLCSLFALSLMACSDPSGTRSRDASDGLVFVDVGDESDVPEADDTVAPDDVPEDVAETPDDGPDLGEPEDVVETPDEGETPDTGPDVPDTGPPPLPAPNGVPLFSNCSAPGGDRNIYDLQDPQCPDHISPAPTSTPGVQVTLTNVIVTAVFGDTTFVQEPGGGPYSGIAVFTHGEPPGEVAPGKIITVSGDYFEYFKQSQIYLDEWQVTGQTEVPQPFVPSHPAHVATGGVMAEMMEGVLLRVEGVSTIHTKPDCPQEFGEFMVTGELRIDDMGFKWDARLGDEFASITGPLAYTFNNFKIEPRNASDLVVIAKGKQTSISKCIESDCIVPATVPGTKQLVVNEVMADPFDNDTGQEWIELYNPGNQPVSIDGWELRDCTGQVIPLVGNNLVVPAKGFFVLGSNANPVTNGGVPVDLAYGDAFYLPNSVGSVLIFSGSGVAAQLVDQTRYSRFEPWKAFQTGRSLERVAPTSDGTVPESWKAGKTVFGTGSNMGTPGEWNDAAN